MLIQNIIHKGILIFVGLGLTLFLSFNLIPLPKLMGYQLGSIVLLLTSLVSVFFGPCIKKNPSKSSRLLIITWLLFAFLYIIYAGMDGSIKEGLLDAYPFLLSIPIFLLLLKNKIDSTVLFKLNVLGSYLLFIGCLAFRFNADSDFDPRLLNTLGMMSIQFACITAAISAINIASVAAFIKNKQKIWSVLALIAVPLTMVLVMFSTARGSFLTLPIIILGFIVCFWKDLPKWFWLCAGIASIGFATAAINTSPVQSMFMKEGRIDEVVNDINALERGNSNTSIGLRFVMWKNAIDLIQEKPLLGWGQSGFMQKKEQLAKESRSTESIVMFGHPHSDILNAFVKKGIIGLLALLMVYGVPFTYFMQSLIHANVRKNFTQKALSFAGLLVVISFVIAGLTQTIFAHNSGRLYFAMIIVILWAFVANTKDETVIDIKLNK